MRCFKRPKQHLKQCGGPELDLRPSAGLFSFFKSMPVGGGGFPPPSPNSPILSCTLFFLFFYTFTSPDAKRDPEPPACPTKTIQQLRRKASIHALFSIGARSTRPCLSPPPIPSLHPPPLPKTSFSTASAAWLAVCHLRSPLPLFVYLFQKKKKPRSI